MRNTMRKTMLGMALVAGLLGTGAAAANAAPRGSYGRGYDRPVAGREFERHDFDRRDYERRDFVRPVNRGFYGGVVVGGPVVDTYIPPCPGDGYTWTAGYYNSGIWVPGAWTFRGGYRGVERGYVGGYAYGRGFDRGFHGRR